ncbi:hypothetical protein KFK09_005822 [Dendrobium nobile]|uniref:Uncharacterized protein n=1 Tax=Dendrobium nobile TaxID=94219 RepID=A0A8T3BWW1_DENNO|nr:hypothetical protein KFK09_005822 [Dendrobium nobile]
MLCLNVKPAQELKWVAWPTGPLSIHRQELEVIAALLNQPHAFPSNSGSF